MITEEYKNNLLQDFNYQAYLYFNPDIRESLGFDKHLAEKHYIENGFWEGRVCNYIFKDTSQSGEYEIICSLISDRSDGFLIDVGAHNGFDLSNSYPFLMKGWSGILVEPLPSAFELLNNMYKSYEDIICLNVACSDVNGSRNLHLGSDGDLSFMSTLCEDDNDWFDKNRSKVSILVKTKTLNSILEENTINKEFKLLLIDCEGHDYEVLNGINLKLSKPELIVTENYTSNMDKHKKKHLNLLLSGYRFAAQHDCNTFWKRNWK